LDENNLKIQNKLLEVFDKLDIEYKKAVLDFAELAFSSQNRDITEAEFNAISSKMHEMTDKMLEEDSF